jgi:hypothetical protein
MGLPGACRIALYELLDTRGFTRPPDNARHGKSATARENDVPDCQ